MIILKSDNGLSKMREAGKITAMARQIGGEAVREGIKTSQIDKVIHDYIISKNAKPSFLGYNGFPASACVSVNEEVIHGIPSDRRLKYGDIVKIDVGAYLEGYHGDCADTFVVGEVDEKVQSLINTTRKCFYKAYEIASEGNRIGDLSNAVQICAEENGFSVVRDFVGHGVGANLHEEPNVPNFGAPGRGARLQKGMTIAVEPMISMGTWKVKVLDNQWTVVTGDGGLSAHYENTIAITDNGPEILTCV